VEIEKLETIETGRAQGGFHFFLVEERHECARGLLEVLVLVEHVVFGKAFPEDLEVARFEVAFVLLDLVIVRVDTPLSDLMRYDGDLRFFHSSTEISVSSCA